MALVAPEVHLDVKRNCDGLALFHRRLETVLANCIHRLLIKIRRQRALHEKILRHPLAVHDQANHEMPCQPALRVSFPAFLGKVASTV